MPNSPEELRRQWLALSAELGRIIAAEKEILQQMERIDAELEAKVWAGEDA